MPQNSVTAITQTQDGYLWIGTQDGLVRFDGVRFQVFDAGTTPAIKNSRIVQLFEDREGVLWIGTEQAGLVRFQEGRFTALTPPHKGTTHNYARAFCDDSGGALWMASCEWQLIRWNQGEFSMPSEGWNLVGSESHSVAAEEGGGIWVGTDAELAFVQQGKVRTVWSSHEEPGFRVEAMAPSRRGGCWVAANHRVRKFQRGGLAADLGACAWTNRPVYSLHEDRGGNIWVATLGSGLFRYGTNGTVLHLSVDDGLPNDFVRCITEDREGNLWAGTEGGGLCRLKPAIFQTYGRKQGLSSDQVTSVHEGAGGDLWIGMNGDGLDQLSKNGIVHFGPAQGLDNGHVWSVLEDRHGSVWAGTWGGLYRKDHDRFSALSDGVSIGWQIFAIHEDNRGAVWLGQQSLGAVSRVIGNERRAIKIPGTITDLDVRAIAEGADGSVWIGTNGDGLYRIKDGNITRFGKKDGLGSETIWCLYPDHEGAIWIGTYHGGLSRWREGRLATITARDGLASDVICQILEDDQGHLWFGSHSGVFRIEKAALNRFADGETRAFEVSSYTRADGLPSVECSGGSQPSGCKSRDGRLWFPTVKGLAVVDPRTIGLNRLPPPVLIESVFIDGKEAQNFAGEKPRGRTVPEPLISPVHEVRASPGSQRFEVHFTALSYRAPQKVKFRYRLEGLEKGWVEAGAQRVAHYSFLKPGGYHFQVAACNNDGVWNAAGARLELIVLPHFWQTGWFLSLVAMGGLGTVIGSVRWMGHRKLRLQLERLERERMVDRERARIAKDIHDDLGSSLTRIALLSELAVVDKDRPVEVEGHARKIAVSARETVRSLDEIVWAVNPKNDTLNSLSEYLSHYATEFFEGSLVSCRFEFPDEFADLALASEIRHHLFLAVKEALHNVLKHARASEAWIRVSVSDSHLEIVVQDDGRGFDAVGQTAARGGDGLGNMAKRISDLGGGWEIASSPGKGTHITFRVPLPAVARSPAAQK